MVSYARYIYIYKKTRLHYLSYRGWRQRAGRTKVVHGREKLLCCAVGRGAGQVEAWLHWWISCVTGPRAAA